MPKYTDRQSWIETAFRGVCTLCVVDCDCGIIHFVSADGHGDYEDGELERLQAAAAKEPAKYYEHSDYDHVDAVFIDGHQYVVDCPCAKIDHYCEWIEAHAEGLVKYLHAYLEDRHQRLTRLGYESKQMAEMLAAAPGAEGQ